MQFPHCPPSGGVHRRAPSRAGPWAGDAQQYPPEQPSTLTRGWSSRAPGVVVPARAASGALGAEMKRFLLSQRNFGAQGSPGGPPAHLLLSESLPGHGPQSSWHPDARFVRHPRSGGEAAGPGPWVLVFFWAPLGWQGGGELQAPRGSWLPSLLALWLERRPPGQRCPHHAGEGPEPLGPRGAFLLAQRGPG